MTGRRNCTWRSIRSGNFSSSRFRIRTCCKDTRHCPSDASRRQSRRRHRRLAGRVPRAKRLGRRRRSVREAKQLHQQNEILPRSVHGLLRVCAKRPRPARGVHPQSHGAAGAHSDTVSGPLMQLDREGPVSPHTSRRRSRRRHRRLPHFFPPGCVPGRKSTDFRQKERSAYLQNGFGVLYCHFDESSL